MRELPPLEREYIDRIVEERSLPTDADDLKEALDGRSDEERVVLFLYWESRSKGTSARLAEMLALQAPPRPNTDATFLHGHCNGSQFAAGPLAGELGDRLKATAEAGGQNVKGKVYLGGLARFPGDPQAWVDGKGDVKRVCEERGWKCTGSVESVPDSRRDDAILAAQELRAVPTFAAGEND
jgi:hypothetical protein